VAEGEVTLARLTRYYRLDGLVFEATAQPDTRSRAIGRSLARTVPAIVIGILFVFIGYGKFENRGVWVTIFEEIGLGQWFRIFTGVVQVTGGVLIVPRRTRTVGAALLACTMLGAAIVDVVVIGSPVVVVPLLLLILIATVWVTSR
jgi:putative oxidoreductase